MKHLFIVILVAFLPAASQAQLGSFTNKVNNKIKTKVNQRVDTKVDQAIDKSLDEIEGKEKAPESKPATSEKEELPAETPAEVNQIKSFSKYDFIPGDQVIFYNNFEQDATAELPLGWNTNGSGEVVTLENVPGKWLRMHQQFNYLSDNTKLLPENYTIEFDVVMQLKNNGWMFPTFSFGFFSTKGEPANGNDFLKDQQKYAAVIMDIYPAASKNSRVKIQSHSEHTSFFNSEPKTLSTLDQYYGKPIHVAVQVQKERLRVWINEEKAFDAPRAVPVNYTMNQLLFKVGSTNYPEEKYGMYVSNIKAATGKADMRHKLMEEGKFSTTAILFDVNSATIKPQSLPVLKEIAAVLKENNGTRIKIIGHTDTDGQEAENLLLSQKRAAAVKEALVNDFGINSSGLDTDGAGETKSVADNKTKEGKAANRRVEFIKQP